MKYPMLIISAFFMAGVLIGEWAEISPAIVLVMALSAAGVVLGAVWLGQRCDGAVAQRVGFLNDRLGMASGVADAVRQEQGIRLTITRGDWCLENSTGVLWRSREK